MKSILLIIILYSFLIIKTLSDNKLIQIKLTINTRFQLYAYFLRYYGFSNYYDINLQNEYSYTDRISPKKLEILSTDYIIVNNTNYTRNLIYEEIEIESNKYSMYWYNIPLVGNINYTGMSFALKPKNESFSLLHILKKDNTTFTYELKTIRDLKDKMEKSIIKFLDDQDSEIIFEIFIFIH